MEIIDEKGFELQAKFAEWSAEMTSLENQLDVLLERGEPLSSPETVSIGVKLTSLQMKLMRLDQEYEDYLLDMVD